LRAIILTGGRYVRLAEPILHLRDVGLVIERRQNTVFGTPDPLVYGTLVYLLHPNRNLYRQIGRKSGFPDSVLEQMRRAGEARSDRGTTENSGNLINL
jgi:hypothetical protein